MHDHLAREANGQMQTYCVRGKVTLAPPPYAQEGTCVHNSPCLPPLSFRRSTAFRCP